MTQKEDKKYLGIDWGEKRIGLSLGNASTKMATPYGVVNSRKELLEIIKTEEIDEIVLGVPISLSGNKYLGEEFEKFHIFLKEKTGLKIQTVDERLSSKAADSLPGTKKTKASRDAIAAMLILQTYLDRL